jgi:hypothetical protein
VSETKAEVMIHLGWRSKGGKAQSWLLKALQKLSIDALQ